ncbi:MAG: Asp-tRNA(Asn)/Glu-tRNA(Gln) amidotransferase subunit GatC [Pseudomonadota bacterium]
MKITKEEIAHVAKLARLSLDEDSIALFTKQVGDILAYMDKLNRLNTEGVSPTSHAISIANAFREDQVRPSISNESALSNAPAKEDAMFVVPKVL